MADFEADAAERRAGWEGFTKLMTVSSVGVTVVLVLMAIFLL